MKPNLFFVVLLVFLSSCESPPEEMILIPSGEFLLGINPSPEVLQFMSDQTAGRNAQPMQRIPLPSFYIDRYEVTYEEFIRFKPRAQYDGARWDEPIRGISWYEAEAYCFWIGKRLPTEFEWEKAARGTQGNLFVWGNEFNRNFANLGRTVQPVGSYTKDASSFGILDMNGNVSEWTASWFKPYPNANYEDANFGEKFKVIRGGAFQKREHGFMKEFAMLTHRTLAPPTARFWDTGFRCARSLKAAS